MAHLNVVFEMEHIEIERVRTLRKTASDNHFHIRRDESLEYTPFSPLESEVNGDIKHLAKEAQTYGRVSLWGESTSGDECRVTLVGVDLSSATQWCA